MQVQAAVNRITFHPSLKSQVLEAVNLVREGHFELLCSGVTSGKMGPATCATIMVLDRAMDYPDLADAARAALSETTFRMHYLHPTGEAEIVGLRSDPILKARTDAVLRKIKAEGLIAPDRLEDLHQILLRYPRTGFLPSYVTPHSAYGEDRVPIYAREFADGYFGITAEIAAMDIQPGHKVLYVGTGSAWPDAIISGLVGEDATLISIDNKPLLIEVAERRMALFGIRNVRHFGADANVFPFGSFAFDRIFLSCPSGPDDRTTALIRKLKIGGFMQFTVEDENDSNRILVRRVTRNTEKNFDLETVRAYRMD